MKITNSNGTVKKKFFNQLIDKNGGIVPALKYTVTPPAIFSFCNVARGYVVEVGPHSLKQGDEVQVVSSDGIRRENFVKNAGDVHIELEENIKPGKDVTVDVETDFIMIQFNNLDEGFYYFDDHEGLVIANNYLSLQISFSELKAHWSGASRNIAMKSLNKRSLGSVMADLSFIPDFYRKIDVSPIKELIILKMLCILKIDAEAKKDACDQYKDFLKSVVLAVEIDNDGAVDVDITDPNLNLARATAIRIKYDSKQ